MRDEGGGGGVAVGNSWPFWASSLSNLAFFLSLNLATLGGCCWWGGGRGGDSCENIM